jgi:hypothetical protein
MPENDNPERTELLAALADARATLTTTIRELPG